MRFSNEIRVSGEFIKGTIKEASGEQEGKRFKLSDFNISELSLSPFRSESDTLREIADELLQLADKLDELNGANVTDGDRKGD